MRPSPPPPSGLAGALIPIWHRSYAADYIGFFMIIAASFYVHAFIEPVHQLFRLDNRARQYPHAAIERVSPRENILFSLVGSLVIIILYSLIFRVGLHKTHVSLLGLFISVFLTSLLTDIVKNAIGRPRPDLIARCKPQPGTPEHDLVSISVCTETDHHTLHDGWRSFPSGHSSWAFSGLGYLALFLAGQLRVFRPHAGLAQILLVFAPLVGASLIAVSRLADYRHDIYDVTTGSLLGILVAYFSYRRYYRSLRHGKCDIPYPNPADASALAVGTSKNRTGDIEHQIPRHEDFSLEDLSEDEAQAYPLTSSSADTGLGDQQDRERDARGRESPQNVGLNSH